MNMSELSIKNKDHNLLKDSYIVDQKLIRVFSKWLYYRTFIKIKSLFHNHDKIINDGIKTISVTRILDCPNRTGENYYFNSAQQFSKKSFSIIPKIDKKGRKHNYHRNNFDKITKVLSKTKENYRKYNMHYLVTITYYHLGNKNKPKNNSNVYK